MTPALFNAQVYALYYAIKTCYLCTFLNTVVLQFLQINHRCSKIFQVRDHKIVYNMTEFNITEFVVSYVLLCHPAGSNHFEVHRRKVEQIQTKCYFCTSLHWWIHWKNRPNYERLQSKHRCSENVIEIQQKQSGLLVLHNRIFWELAYP